MAHQPKHLQAILEQAAPPDLLLAFRAMFGGIMGYAEGKPFASLSDVGLALKFTGAEHAAFLAEPGVVRLRYQADQPLSRTYLVVPDRMLSDAATLRPWIERCVAGLAAQPRKRR